MINVWLNIYLILIGVSSLYIYFKHGNRRIHYRSLLVIATLIFFIIKQILQIIAIDELFWLDLLVISMILSYELVFIREAKPDFLRSPFVYVFIPYLSLLFFPLILNTDVLQSLVVGVFQAVALLVALLLFIIEISNKKMPVSNIMPLLVLILGYTLYWARIGDKSIAILIYGAALVWIMSIKPRIIYK